ncbi:MAG: nucleotidyltransferase family protein [bacterium]|nr:nucleotidyltransferase family protein [bacterium]
MDKVRKAVILAGGLGTRLYPVTLEIPKPLLTVNRRPILNYLLDLFTQYGVDEQILLINKDHQDDYRWWQRRYLDSLSPGLQIEIEPEPLGTFGGLKDLQSKLQETFILSNADELKDFNLNVLTDFHRKLDSKPIATIALVQVPNPSNYGVPIMEGDQIKKFLEKPKNPPADFISSGLYILEPDIFQYADFSKKHLMIEKDIFPKLAFDNKLSGLKMDDGRWFDCGTFERWERAIKEW